VKEDLSGPLGSLSADAGASEPEVRWRTAALMADIPGEETETLLLGLLKDPDYRVRERAVAALSSRLTDRVGETCHSALGDDADAGHRAAAVALLTAAGRPGTRFLLMALESASADVRIAGAMNLPSASIAQEAVGALTAVLEREKDPNVRAALVLALGRTKRREAVASLLPLLEHGNVWMKVHAIEALGEIGDPDTSGFLIARIADPALRRGALQALARLGTSRPADELARIAAQEGLDADLVHALRSALEAGSPETVALVRGLWPGAFDALVEILASDRASPASRSDAAHVLVILDLRGACLEILRAGPFLDGFSSLGHLSRTRIGEGLHIVLQSEDPEPALVVVERAVELDVASLLAPLLVHPAAAVRAAVLNSLPPGTARLSDLIDILAEEDPETSLPAALALAASAPDTPRDRLEAQKRALLDRAGGADGPGKVGALLALGEVDGPDVDAALCGAIGSLNPDVRTAAVRAAANRPAFPVDVVKSCLEDPAPAVRAAALRTFARWAERGREKLPLDWKDCLVFLADEGPVAPAAGAAIVALAGPDRPRMAEELLAQGEAIRLAALEEIARTGDADAAESVALAAVHEDTETARAALLAQSVARPGPASVVAALALGDPRPAIRRAAAELAERRGAAWGAGPVASALARALASETNPGALEALLKAVPAAGDDTAIAPMTILLAEERVPAGAQEAAEALAERFEEAVRREWRTAPARSERRWAQALSAAAARGTVPGGAKAGP
jgi:HEAT repeat protein